MYNTTKWNLVFLISFTFVVCMGLGFIWLNFWQHKKDLVHDLSQSSKAQAVKINKLQAKNIELKHANDLLSDKNQELVKKVNQLTVANAELKQKVTWYNSVLGKRSDKSALAIDSFTVLQDAFKTNNYSYKMVLTNASSNTSSNQELTGECKLVALGQYNESWISVFLQNQEYSYKIRKTVQGFFELPDNFKPTSMLVACKTNRQVSYRVFDFEITGIVG